VVKLVIAETGPVSAKANWVAFSVAGAQHMLVECTQETFVRMRRLAELCDERGYRPDEVLATLAADWMVQTETSEEADAAEHAEASVSRSEAGSA